MNTEEIREDEWMNEIFKTDNSNKRIIDLVNEKLEERNIIEHWETFSHKIIESWTNLSLK